MAGPYKIAPTSSATPIGMAQMTYGLINSVDYNHSNLYTAATSSMIQIVTAQESIQPAYSSSTWNEATPYGILEMVNQTWNNDLQTLTTTTQVGLDGAFYSAVTVKKNNVTVGAYGSFTASLGDTIQVTGSASNVGGSNPDTAELYKDATTLDTQFLNVGNTGTVQGSFTVTTNHTILLTWLSQGV